MRYYYNCEHCERYYNHTGKYGCPQHFMGVTPIAKLELERKEDMDLQVRIPTATLTLGSMDVENKKYLTTEGELIDKDSFLTKSWFLDTSPPDDLDRRAIEEIDDSWDRERLETVIAHLKAWRKIEKKSPRRVLSRSYSLKKLFSSYRAYYRSINPFDRDYNDFSNVTLVPIIRARNLLHSLQNSKSGESNATLNDAAYSLLTIAQTYCSKNDRGDEKVIEFYVNVDKYGIYASSEMNVYKKGQWDEYGYHDVANSSWQITKISDGKYQTSHWGGLINSTLSWPSESSAKLEEELEELNKVVQLRKSLSKNPKKLLKLLNEKFSELSQWQQFEVIAQVCDQLQTVNEFPYLAESKTAIDAYRCIWILCNSCARANATIVSNKEFCFDSDGLSVRIISKRYSEKSGYFFQFEIDGSVSYRVRDLLNSTNLYGKD